MSNLNNIQSFNVTAQLQLIQAKAQLSNAVSAQALHSAIAVWSKYQSKYDYERDANALVTISRHINLIVAQVTNRVTRINPLMWSELIRLNAVINTAIVNGINLEPRPLPVEPANDDNNLREVSNA